jgi:hypothetical protein
MKQISLMLMVVFSLVVMGTNAAGPVGKSDPPKWEHTLKKTTSEHFELKAYSAPIIVEMSHTATLEMDRVPAAEPVVFPAQSSRINAKLVPVKNVKPLQPDPRQLE